MRRLPWLKLSVAYFIVALLSLIWPIFPALALRYRVFAEVWAVRSLLLRAEALPGLSHPDAYGFVDASGEPGGP